MTFTDDYLYSLDERELDALIAEHLFGFQWARVAKTRTRMLVPPDRLPEERGGLLANFRLSLAENAYRHVPPYGSDIAAAWLVVEILRLRTRHGFSVQWVRELGRWVAGPVCPDPDWRLTYADTAPQAIRLAALRLCLL